MANIIDFYICNSVLGKRSFHHCSYLRDCDGNWLRGLLEEFANAKCSVSLGRRQGKKWELRTECWTQGSTNELVGMSFFQRGAKFAGRGGRRRGK